MLIYFSGSGVTFVLLFLIALFSGSINDKNQLYGNLVISICMLAVNYIWCLVVFATGIIMKVNTGRLNKRLLLYSITGYLFGILFDYIINKEVSFSNELLLISVLDAIVFGSIPYALKSKKIKIISAIAPVVILIIVIVFGIFV